MVFEQFQKQVLDEMKARFPDMEVEVKEVTKLQGRSYTGITVRPEGDSVAVCVNLQSFFEEMNEGVPFEDVAGHMEDFILNGREQALQFDLRDMMNYEKMKDSLIMQMIPIEGNERELEDLPHKVIEDMATVYRLEIDKKGDNVSSTVITNQMLQSYGVTKEQLHADALKAMEHEYPPYIRNMTDVMKDMVGDIDFLIPDEPSALWVASVEGGDNGAVAIQYPGFLERAAETLGGDFFILPSSMHETLFVLDDGSYSLEMLELMVRMANEQEVPLEERLSNSVFHYDSEAHVFENARTFELRMNDKDNLVQEAHVPEKGTIRVLLVEPLQHPKAIEIPNKLESLQNAVDGYIEVTYPFKESVGLIMNGEGKDHGLPLNRALYDEKGEMYDIIAGSFLVAGLSHNNFASLSPDQMKKFEERFYQPETFVRMGKGIMAIPVPEEKVKSAHRKSERALTDKSHTDKAKERTSDFMDR